LLNESTPHEYIIRSRFLCINTLQGYSSSEKNSCKEAMGAMFVYDVQTETSLENLSQYRKTFNSLVTQVNGDPIPAVLVGNKVITEQCSSHVHA